MKGNSFINLTDTDDKAGAFLLATAITTGVSDAITGEDNGSSTGTLALINGMKKLNGDPDFNISDYTTIDKDGDIDLKDYQEGEPLTITQLRYAEKIVGCLT